MTHVIHARLIPTFLMVELDNKKIKKDVRTLLRYELMWVEWGSKRSHHDLSTPSHNRTCSQRLWTICKDRRVPSKISTIADIFATTLIAMHVFDSQGRRMEQMLENAERTLTECTATNKYRYQDKITRPSYRRLEQLNDKDLACGTLT